MTREFAVAELLAREPSAVEHLYDALALATDPAPRAEIALLLGKALVNAGRLADADAVLTAVISEVGDRDLKRAARLETWRTGIGLLDWRFRAGVEQRLPRLRSLAERSGLDGRALLVLLACRAAMNGAARAEVLELVSSAFGDGRFLGAETADDLPLPFMMRLLAWVDELDRADQVHHGLLSAARRGSIEAFAIAAVCAASTALRRGALAAAEAEARTAIELARQHNIKDYEPFARALLGEALLERGDLGQAAAAVDGIDFEWMREMGPGSLLLYVRGRLRAARGDRQGAAADLRECGRIHELNGYRNPNIVPWQSALALVVPDTPEGRSLVAAELSRARKAGQPRAIGVALRAMALLSGRHERIPLLREAAETLRSSPSALELARTLTDYGAALARTGQGTSAREPLQQGMDLAARCGAAALARRAREDLLAIGARPRRERLTGAESLTPGELGVARLAAEGLTNRQIAQALFISTKTVGTHLGHIYDKIGTSSREGLAQIMREASRAAQ